MGPIGKFFASLKRLLESGAPPPAESIDQSTADRPPPVEAAPSPPSSAALRRDDDAATEVRALLEAMSDVAPPPAETSPAETSPAESSPAQPAEVPPPELEPMAPPPAAAAPVPTTPRVAAAEPAVSSAADEDTVTAPPIAAPELVEGALVLTLSTPAATFTVVRSSATLGRGEENTIRLNDLSVSRRHARIAFRQGGYWISDLGSMGGTWVQGSRLVAPRKIAAGEVIDIGLCRLTVSLVDAAPRAATKRSSSKPRSEMATQGRRRR